MPRILYLVAVLLVALAVPASTQQPIQCPTRPVGDNTNACASTAFVQANVGSGAGSVLTVTNSNGTLAFSPISGNVVGSLNLNNPNTWVGLQTFGTPPVLSSITGAIQCLHVSATGLISGTGTDCGAGGGGGGVSSVANTDSTLTVSPTTGAVISSLNLAHANTWTALQTFSAGTSNSALTLSSITGSVQCLHVNTSGLVSGTGSDCGSGGGGGITSVTNADGTLTFSTTTGAVTGSLATAHANTWAGAQTFNGGATANALTLSGITGSTQCLHVNTSGVVSGTAADCGSGGSLPNIPTTNILANTSGSTAAPIATTGTTWFDSAWCNTTARSVVRSNTAWGCQQQAPINAISYGADPTGVADSTTAITNALGATGSGTVLLPPGTYNISSITIPSGECLVGSGMSTTALVQATGTGDAVVISGGAYSCVMSMKITNSVTKTSGSLIRVANAHNVLLRDLLIGTGANSGGNCVLLDGGASQYAYFLEHLELGSCATGITLGSTAVVQDVNMSHVIVGPGSAGCTTGISMITASGVYLTDSEAIQCVDGIKTFPGTGQSVSAVRMENFLADTNSHDGINVANNGGQGQFWQLVNVWASGNGSGSTGSGLEMTMTLDTIIITGGDYSNNKQHGIVANSGPKNTVVNGVAACSNGTDGYAAASGIVGIQIVNSVMGNCGFTSVTPAAGVVLSSADDKILIMGNRFPGNTTPILDNSTTSNKIITNNGNW